jgi:hypothetical protein
LRAFSTMDRYESEGAAHAACWALGSRIIDRSRRDCSVDQLVEES